MGEQAEWDSGVWLGVFGRSEEVLVGTPEKIITCFAAKSLPTNERWSWEFLDQRSETPWR